MERQFQMTMHAPLGDRHGYLWLEQDHNELHGRLDILGHSANFDGSLGPHGEVIIDGQIRSALSSFRYLAEGRLQGTHLHLTVRGGRYNFQMDGEEMKTKESVQ